MNNLNVTYGMTGVRITGLKETLRALEKTGVDAQDLKNVMREISDIVARAATPRTPVKKGKLALSIRSGSAKTKATVYAGNGRKNGVPYAGVIHYGWPARSITARPFLDEARALNIERAVTLLAEELGRLADNNKLDNTL